MKKLTIIIIILALVVISVFAYFYLTQIKDFCCLDRPPGCSDNFYVIVEQEDVQKCDTDLLYIEEERRNPFYDNECRERCVESIAHKNGDVTICSQISNIKDISSEEERINGWPNLKKGGFSIKDRCYKNFAEELEDASICAQSETPYGKETCKQLVESLELKQYRQKLREQQKK